MDQSTAENMISYLSIDIGDSISAAIEQIEKIGTDKKSDVTCILNAEYQLGQYSACMHMLEQISMDKFLEYGEQYSADVHRVLEGINKLYYMVI